MTLRSGAAQTTEGEVAAGTSVRGDGAAIVAEVIIEMREDEVRQDQPSVTCDYIPWQDLGTSSVFPPANSRAQNLPDVRAKQVKEHDERLLEDEVGHLALVARAPPSDNDGVCELDSGPAAVEADRVTMVYRANEQM